MFVKDPLWERKRCWVLCGAGKGGVCANKMFQTQESEVKGMGDIQVSLLRRSFGIIQF